MSPTHEQESILVVEDDDIDYMVFERMVKRQGLPGTLIRAMDGEEGLRILEEMAQGQSSWPYLVILDMNTPKMSGIEFLTALRQRPAIAHAVVFVFSTSNAPRDISDCYKQSVAGYVVKDVDISKLSSFIDMLDCYRKSVAHAPPRLTASRS